MRDRGSNRSVLIENLVLTEALTQIRAHGPDSPELEEVFDAWPELSNPSKAVVLARRALASRSTAARSHEYEQRWHNGQHGARYRVRTCDPYRVKVVLYH
jgi:hypothetical protein